jgi:pimeloyl-ACP methyl ester carboxylesterase
VTERQMATRRGVLQTGIAGAGGLALGAAPAVAWSVEQKASPPELTDDPAGNVPSGLDARFKRAVAVGGGELPVWDSGGRGDAVVLVHATSGTGAAWQYQFDYLRQKGLRAITYSRRGTAEAGAASAGIDTEVADLLATLDALGVDRCHLVGTASGGMLVARFASRYQWRLRSLTISCSVVAVDDKVCAGILANLASHEFLSLPSAIKELSPSYRATQVAGVARWLEIEKSSVSARLGQTGNAAAGFRAGMVRGTPLSPADLGAIKVPVLLIYADADMYSPPPLARRLTAMFRNSTLVVIAEAGHAAHWEKPAQFNQALAKFVASAKRS